MPHDLESISKTFPSFARHYMIKFYRITSTKKFTASMLEFQLMIKTRTRKEAETKVKTYFKWWVKENGRDYNYGDRKDKFSYEIVPLKQFLALARYKGYIWME